MYKDEKSHSEPQQELWAAIRLPYPDSDYQFRVTDTRMNDFRLSVELENSMYKATVFALTDMTPTPSNLTVTVKPKQGSAGLNLVVIGLRVYIQDPELACIDLAVARKLLNNVEMTLNSAQALQDLFDGLTANPHALSCAESLRTAFLELTRNN